jgi:hypothetical protein
MSVGKAVDRAYFVDARSGPEAFDRGSAFRQGGQRNAAVNETIRPASIIRFRRRAETTRRVVAFPCLALSTKADQQRHLAQQTEGKFMIGITESAQRPFGCAVRPQRFGVPFDAQRGQGIRFAQPAGSTFAFCTGDSPVGVKRFAVFRKGIRVAALHAEVVARLEKLCCGRCGASDRRAGPGTAANEKTAEKEVHCADAA